MAVAASVAEVENGGPSGTLLLFAQSQRVTDDSLLEPAGRAPAISC